MSNLLETFEKKQIERLTGKKRIPTFRPGDTLKVTIRITEGDKSRLQAFEGMCIARKNNSVNSNFTVRKISHGEGVERVFPLFSPIVEKIEVVRKGDVRRAKLYYLRDRTGKSARIADRDRGDELDQYAMVEEIVSEEVESNKNEASSEIGKETNKEEKTAVTEELPKVDSSVETKVEEQKEPKPAKEVEQKTDEQS
tara:strand:+ start:870 stop:1460 length:591 start_codon:yes stop_codon:yes gene_type:complete